jgi:hypothetical protein
MKFIARCVAVFGVLGVLAACSALRPGSSPSAGSVSPPTVSASAAPTASAAPQVSSTPTMLSESVAPSSAAGYVDPAVAAQLAAKCQVAGAIGYYFVIPPGSSFQTIFPGVGLTPELDGLQGLFVAVYDGDVRILNYTGGRPDPSATFQVNFQNVVCVVPPTGEVEVYSNVSHQVMALPPGAQVGSPPTIAP